MGTVAIVGVGLIGGSVGLCLRARGLASRVIGVGRDRAKLDLAVHLGAIDEGRSHAGSAAAEADVVVVCTPVSRIASDCRELALSAGDRVLITDVGSTKAAIVEDVGRDPRAARVFCGAHPIAGSEKQGVGAARADLFEGRTCVVTPSDVTPADRLDRARGFWSGVGCRVEVMSPEEHDRALALTSHLPHVVASAVAGAVGPDLGHLAAGSFRDVTRVASADADLWAAIFLANRGPVLDALCLFRDRLDTFQGLLQAGNAPGLAQWWNEAKASREASSPEAPAIAEPPASRGPR